MDETEIFLKCLPSKTLTFINNKCYGRKNSKECIAVVICANMLGKEKKTKLLVIEKIKHSRCYKGVKSLKVDYDINKKV